MMSGSSSHQPCCWVNGCQSTRRSVLVSSRVLMANDLRHGGGRIRSVPMRRLPEPPLGLVVFVVGVSILGAEIAAARLLAPYFGASTIVWANTIGIVLVALSAGYWYGGRLADRNPTPAGLYRIVLLSGLLLAAVPF